MVIAAIAALARKTRKDIRPSIWLFLLDVLVLEFFSDCKEPLRRRSTAGAKPTALKIRL
jgi:hypothetical protein